MAQLMTQRDRGIASSASLERADDGDGLRLLASGAWTIAAMSALERTLKRVVPSRERVLPASGRLEVADLSALDTAGAWLLRRIADTLHARGCEISLVGLSDAQRMLIEEVERHSTAERLAPDRQSWLAAFASSAADGARRFVQELLIFVSFLGEVTVALLRTVTWRSRFRWTAFVHHLEFVGLRAVPIIALICFLIGAVVMQQGALQLSSYGAEPYAASMLTVLALREVGVLLTAIMVAGRSASAFTAEIGSMKMREEIAAMRTIGIDPVDTLVLPRIVALLVALPLLTLVGDLMCLSGGAVVAVFHLDQSLHTFIERMHTAAESRHFAAGMIKTPFAALVIGLIGCSEGLRVGGSAESLGRQVTLAVVKAIFVVIILGALFSMFLVSVGV